MDEEKISGAGLGDVYDDHNSPNLDKSVYDDGPAMSDMNVSGTMKILFILCGLVGIFYSLYAMGIFQAVVWVLALVFILDIMGTFDKVGAFFKESRKPRGGYKG